MTAFSVAILAGGQSRRMGRNKALLEVGGSLVLQRIIDCVADLTDDLFLVTNTPQTYAAFKLPMVADTIPDKAALGGIYSAIQQARHPWVFVVACDMPLLEAQVITFLASLRHPDDDVVIPKVTPHPETLHAFYNKRCLPAIRTRLERDRLKVIGFFEEVRVQYVDQEMLAAVTADLNFLINMNTPEELAMVRALIEGEG